MLFLPAELHRWKWSKFGKKLFWLVVSTPLKNMLVKMGSSSPNRGENKEYLSCHHPVLVQCLFPSLRILKDPPMPWRYCEDPTLHPGNVIQVFISPFQQGGSFRSLGVVHDSHPPQKKSTNIFRRYPLGN